LSIDFPGSIEALSVLRAIEANLLEWYRFLASVLPGAEIREEADMVRTFAPVDHPGFNAILQVRFAHGTTRRRIEDALNDLRERGRPGMWWIGPSAHPVDLATRLVRHGCLPTDTLVGMAVDLRGGSWKQVAGARGPVPTIRQAVRASELAEWALPFSEGFGMREDTLRYLAPIAAVVSNRAAGPCLRFFLATLEEGPVASCMLYVGAGVAGLYGVATVTRHRNQGYATEVVRAALDVARAEGCRVCVLHATPLAVSVYRRLGFVEYCRLRTLTYYPPTRQQ